MEKIKTSENSETLVEEISQENNKTKSLEKVIDSIQNSKNNNKDKKYPLLTDRRFEHLKKISIEDERDSEERAILKKQLRNHLIEIEKVRKLEQERINALKTTDPEQDEIDTITSEIDTAQEKLEANIDTNDGVDESEHIDTLTDYNEERLESLTELSTPKEGNSKRLLELKAELADLLEQIKVQQGIIAGKILKTELVGKTGLAESNEEQNKLKEEAIEPVSPATGASVKEEEPELSQGKDGEKVDKSKLTFLQSTLRKVNNFLQSDVKDIGHNLVQSAKKATHEMIHTRKGRLTAAKIVAVGFISAFTFGTLNPVTFIVAKAGVAGLAAGSLEATNQQFFKKDYSEENQLLYEQRGDEKQFSIEVGKLSAEINKEFEIERDHILTKRGKNWTDEDKSEAIEQLAEARDKSLKSLSERAEEIRNFKSKDQLKEYTKEGKKEITDGWKILKSAGVAITASVAMGSLFEYLKSDDVLTPQELGKATATLGVDEQMELFQDKIDGAKTNEIKLAYMSEKADIIEEAIEKGDKSPELLKELTELKADMNNVNEVELTKVETEIARGQTEIDKVKIAEMKAELKEMPPKGASPIDDLKRFQLEKDIDELKQSIDNNLSVEEKGKYYTLENDKVRLESMKEGLDKMPADTGAPSVANSNRVNLEKIIAELEDSIKERTIEAQNNFSLEHSNDLLSKQSDLLESKIEYLESTDPKNPEIEVLQNKLDQVDLKLTEGYLLENKIELKDIDEKLKALAGLRDPSDLTPSKTEIDLMREKASLLSSQKDWLNDIDFYKDTDSSGTIEGIMEAKEKISETILQYDHSQLTYIESQCEPIGTIPEDMNMQDKINKSYLNIEQAVTNLDNLDNLEDFDNPAIHAAIEKLKEDIVDESLKGSHLQQIDALGTNFSQINGLVNAEIDINKAAINKLSEDIAINGIMEVKTTPQMEEELAKLMQKQHALELMKENIGKAMENQGIGNSNAEIITNMNHDFTNATGVEGAQNSVEAMKSLDLYNTKVIRDVVNESDTFLGNFHSPERDAFIKKVISLGGEDFQKFLTVEDAKGLFSSDVMDVNYEKAHDLSESLGNKIDSVKNLIGPENNDALNNWQKSISEKFNIPYDPAHETAREFASKVAHTSGVSPDVAELSQNFADYGKNMNQKALLDVIAKVNPKDMGFGNVTPSGDESFIPKTQVELAKPEAVEPDVKENPLDNSVFHAKDKFGRH